MRDVAWWREWLGEHPIIGRWACQDMLADFAAAEAEIAERRRNSEAIVIERELALARVNALESRVAALTEAGQDAFAWLIERPGPEWWTGVSHHHDGIIDWIWSKDAIDAVRFGRRGDAAKVAVAIGISSGAFVTEHGFADLAGPAPKAGEEVTVLGMPVVTGAPEGEVGIVRPPEPEENGPQLAVKVVNIGPHDNTGDVRGVRR